MDLNSLCRILFVPVLVSCFFEPGQVKGAIISVEPDDFAVDQDLTNAVPGVTFSVANALGDATSTVFNQVIVVDGTAPSTGSRVFGRQLAAFVPNQDWFAPDPIHFFVLGIFRADFSVPTDFVSIDIIDLGSADQGQLEAFDAGGNLLDTFIANLSGTGDFVTASIARPSADIAYILAAGFPGGGPPVVSVSLDNFKFDQITTQIPEPTTLGLLAFAIAGLVVTLYWRKPAG